jgi:fructokinase
MDIVCVGEMVIDFLPTGQEGCYCRKAGGAPANVAIAAARNGISSGFCGTVGEDDFGRFLHKTLEENAVQVLRSGRIEQAVTTMTFVTLDEKGERSFTFARKPGADMFLSREDIKEEFLQECTVVHAGSCSLSADPAADATAYAMERAHQLGKLVSFDVNYRGLLWNEDCQAAMAAVRKILPLVDLLKVSEEEAEMLGGKEALLALAKENDIAVTIITLGSRGAECHWQGQVLFHSAFKSNCVDTTGAGDAFWGAFLSTLVSGGVKQPDQLKKELLEEALLRGNIAGSLCVQKKGAIEALPYARELEQRRKELGL